MDLFQSIWSYSGWLAVVYVLTIATIILTIVQQRGDPTKTLAWIVFIAVIPIIGLVFYLVFGKNYRREKMLNRKDRTDQMQLAKVIGPLISNDFHVWFKDKNGDKLQFDGIAQMLSKANYTIPTLYNKATLLKNGKRKYEALFSAIESAKEHIHLEYYIIEDDKIGNQLRELLEKKAKEGVEVRLIYDDFGSWSLSKKYKESLIKSGVQVFPFFKIHMLLFKSKINYRNHRKIAVIDGKIGFVGGINIADHYLDGIPNIGIWRDTHVMLEGDSVHWLQTFFLMDWVFVSKKQITNTGRYFPEYSKENKCMVQIAASGPDSDWASIMQTYFMAVNLAEERVYIASPYFIPNESFLTALRTAAMRGVDVRILMSARSDSSITQWASMSYVDDIMSAGVRVFLYEKGFTHSKLIMSDGKFCSIGTANMDVRSFEHNFEINALFYDEEFTQLLEKEFLHDLRNSTEVNHEEWKNRPRKEKFMENTCRLLAPLL